MDINSNKSTTSPVILFAIIALGFIVGYFYYSQFSSQNILESAPLAIPEDDNLTKFNSLTLDFGPFDNLNFKSLRVFGESPVQAGVSGRPDIFAPF
ncbi:MAG TPA: hypothetical protein VJH71_00070 [Candidatus Paceibacterota bacterium]